MFESAQESGRSLRDCRGVYVVSSKAKSKSNAAKRPDASSVHSIILIIIPTVIMRGEKPPNEHEVGRECVRVTVLSAPRPLRSGVRVGMVKLILHQMHETNAQE